MCSGRPTGPGAPDDPGITFLTGGIDAAVAAALGRTAAAAGRNVVVFGASLAGHALAAGLLDELVIHVAPILLGEGIAPGRPGRAGSGRASRY